MASNLGPTIAIKTKAAAGFTNAGFLENEILQETLDGRVLVFTSYSKSLRQKLNNQKSFEWLVVGQVLREDAENYFAFADAAERCLFQELTKLDSLGPKLAALIVGQLSRANLLEMMNSGKPALGVKITGLGPKKLQSLASGLKLQKKRFEALLGPAPNGAKSRASTLTYASDELPSDVAQAFEKFGLSINETKKLFQQCLEARSDLNGESVGVIVRVMLQRWGQNKHGRLSEETLL